MLARRPRRRPARRRAGRAAPSPTPSPRSRSSTAGSRTGTSASSTRSPTTPRAGSTCSADQPVAARRPSTRATSRWRCRIDGEEVSTGTGAACLGDPLNAAGLAGRDRSRRRRRRCAPGEVVLSGALGPMVAVAAGRHGPRRRSPASGSVAAELQRKDERMSRTQGRHHRLGQHRHRPDDQGAAAVGDPRDGRDGRHRPRLRRPGARRAARRRRPPHDGVDGLIALPGFDDIEIVFDATSAEAHIGATPRALAPYGKRLVDLTPGGDRPVSSCRRSTSTSTSTPPTSTWSPAAARPRSRSSPRSSRVDAGALRRDRRLDRLEVGRARAPARTSTSSPRPPRTAIEAVGGAERGKAIIVLNPAEPPLIMRDTVFCLVGDADARRRSRRRSRRWSPRCATYVPGYRLKQEVQFDRVAADEPVHTLRRRRRRSPHQGVGVPRGRGRRRTTCRLRRQPRHHDLGRAARRRADRRATRAPEAAA